MVMMIDGDDDDDNDGDDDAARTHIYPDKDAQAEDVEQKGGSLPWVEEPGGWTRYLVTFTGCLSAMSLSLSLDGEHPLQTISTSLIPIYTIVL